jgi:hypothetical protein
MGQQIVREILNQCLYCFKQYQLQGKKYVNFAMNT